MSSGIDYRSLAAQPSSITVIAPRRRAVNLRSVLLGLVGVIFICGFTPFNNYALNNTDLVGNFLPTGLLLFFFIFILAFNAPLLKWLPQIALSRGELTVAMAMMLVSCTLPSSGLMRYLPGNLVAYQSFAVSENDTADVLEQMHLPSWMFPAFKSKDVADHGREDVITGWQGKTFPAPTFWGRVMDIPWRAWRAPAMAWGMFLAAIYGAILCGAVIIRQQWVENERLPFPIASVYGSLLEAPPPGKAFNMLFSSRGFWITFGIVFGIQSLNALSSYFPRIFPAIPMRFDLSGELANPPFASLDGMFKAQTIYFAVIGITYFIQARTAFSLWFFFVLVQVAKLVFATHQQEFTDGMQMDQFFGGIIPYVLIMLWLARRHLLMVVKQMFRGRRRTEPRGKYLPLPVAGWGFAVCVFIMAAWLIRAGASPAGSLVIVAMLLTLFLVLARIVAETGLLYVLLPLGATGFNRPWIFLGQDMPARLTTRTTMPTFFLGNVLGAVLMHDTRQSLPAYATHALRVADSTIEDSEAPSRIPFFMTLVLSLVIGFAVSGASTLYVHYTYRQTLEAKPSALDPFGNFVMPKWMVMEPTKYYLTKNGLPEPHSRWVHFGIGAGVSAGLSIMRARYAWWPLHPLGFLLAYSLGLRWVWFSIFLGWLLKVVIVRFGGSDLYRKSREIFIGMIFGEAGAVAFWLIVAILCSAAGIDHPALQFQIS